MVMASAGDDKKISLWRKNGQSMGTIPVAGADSGDNIEVFLAFFGEVETLAVLNAVDISRSSRLRISGLFSLICAWGLFFIGVVFKCMRMCK
jgi:hypothetical protein